MKIEGIDDRIVMPMMDTDEEGNVIQGEPEVVWYVQPITEEEADRQNNIRKSAVSIAENLDGKDAMMILQAMTSQKEVEPTRGKPWTIRQSVISSMYSHRYPKAEKDKKTGDPIHEKAEIVAEMQRIGNAFFNAPLFGYVELDADQIKLLRRKMYEFGLPGYVHGHMTRVLDELEGKLKKVDIEYGPMEKKNGGSNDAEQTAEVTDV